MTPHGVAISVSFHEVFHIRTAHGVARGSQGEPYFLIHQLLVHIVWVILPGLTDVLIYHSIGDHLLCLSVCLTGQRIVTGSTANQCIGQGCVDIVPSVVAGCEVVALCFHSLEQPAELLRITLVVAVRQDSGFQLVASGAGVGHGDGFLLPFLRHQQACQGRGYGYVLGCKVHDGLRLFTQRLGFLRGQT